MCYLNDGGPGIIQFLEELHDFFRLAGVQVACRLVGKDQLRIAHHRARYAYQLLLAAGELAGIQIFLTYNLKTIKNLGYHARALRARQIAIGKRNIEIFVDGQVIEQVIALKEKTK